METRVIFSDIDDTVTFTRTKDGKKVRVIDRKAIAKVRKLVKSGYKVAFITGKAEDYVRRDFIPILEEFGVKKEVPVYGEHGFYEITSKGVVMGPEARAFLPERNKIVQEVLKEAKKRQINFVPVADETKQVMLYFKPTDASPEKREELKRVILEVIQRLRERGEITHQMVVNLTRSGCDVYPSTTSKANAVDIVLKKWGISGNVRGRAYGDMHVDLGLAQKPRVKFYIIRNESKQFIKEISHLNFKFWCRKMRGCIVPIKRKMLKKLRKPITLVKHRQSK